MFVIVALIVLGIIIFFASQREKEERIERVSSMGQDLIYMQTYIYDLILAGYDMAQNQDSYRQFMDFKKMVLNNQRAQGILQDHIRMGQNRKHEEGYEEFLKLKSDFTRLRDLVGNAESYNDLFPGLTRLESFIVLAFNGEATREEIIAVKERELKNAREMERQILASM